MINSSLMALKDSVRALARGGEWGLLAGRSPLTKVLKQSFTGSDSQCLVLATVSPAAKVRQGRDSQRRRVPASGPARPGLGRRSRFAGWRRGGWRRGGWRRGGQRRVRRCDVRRAPVHAGHRALAEHASARVHHGRPAGRPTRERRPGVHDGRHLRQGGARDRLRVHRTHRHVSRPRRASRTGLASRVTRRGWVRDVCVRRPQSHTHSLIVPRCPHVDEFCARLGTITLTVYNK